MLDTTIAKLAKLQKQKVALEEQIDAEKEKVVLEMKKKKITQYKNDAGSFSISQRVAHKFSESFEKLKEKLEMQKVDEIESGVAQVDKITEYLSPKFKKDK